MDCDLCHEEAGELSTRSGRQLCERCTDGWDYQMSLTPEELREEERSVSRYVDENSP